MPFVQQKLNQMLQFARNHYAFQQLYFSFETGNIYGPYLFEAHRHSESHMCAEFGDFYNRHRAANAAHIHGHHVSHVFIYTVNSPCGEPHHQCGTLLRGLPNHFPVNHRYILGYSRVWDGLERNTQQERADIRNRSLAVLQQFNMDPNWTVAVEA